MPALPTPGNLTLRAELYHQIATFAASGIPMRRALEMLRRAPPSRSFRAPLERMGARLDAGDDFASALRAEKSWLPEFDIALIEAGERSGRIDTSLQILAGYYRERAAIVRTMISELACPMFVLHAAVFIVPFPQLFQTGDFGAYLTATFGVLIPIYAVVALMIFAVQGRHGELWRSIIEALARWIPVLGSARHSLALSRLAVALDALLNAGVFVASAWELAAAASGSPALKREIAGWRSQIETNQKTPAELANDSRLFPELFANLYHSGEISAHSIHFVYISNSRNMIFICLTPNSFTLWLNTSNGAKHSYRTI